MRHKPYQAISLSCQEKLEAFRMVEHTASKLLTSDERCFLIPDPLPHRVGVLAQYFEHLVDDYRRQNARRTAHLEADHVHTRRPHKLNVNLSLGVKRGDGSRTH